MIRSVRCSAALAGASVFALAGACALAAVALAPAPARAACPPGKFFGPSLAYFTSPSPHAACLADLDGDGILDLVTASGAVLAPGVDNAVTVRRGRGTAGVGNGRFGAPRDYPAGVRPYHVVAADFDEDGVPDLAVANVGSGRVSVLRGLGGGAFALPVSYVVGASPFYLAAGDLDQDGVLDLVVVNNGSSSVSVLLGNGSGGVGDGTFTVHGSYNVLGANPAAVEIGDFSHDGVPDLAVALYGGEVAVLRANAVGGVWAGGYLTAQKYFVGSSGAFGLAQADLTEDGLLDLVTANNGGKISVLVGQEIPGNDAAMFTGLRTYPAGTGPGTLALADFDEDGRLDVITANSSVDSITVLLRSGPPGIDAASFGTPSRYRVAGFPLGLAVGDLNEDGHRDVVVAGWSTHDVTVMLGACAIAPQPIAEPQLHAPFDVPADEGGRVHLTWIASDFDANVTQAVTSYRVWRRLPSGLFPKLPARGDGAPSASAALAPIARVEGTTVTYWEAVAVLPAQGDAQYAYDAATTRDSTAGENPYTAYFVTAATGDPNVFYDSKPESAYSVDNTAPPAPSPFVAVYGPDRATLHWGVSPAADRSAYRLYRGPSSSFVPAPSNRIATLPDTGYVDLAAVSVSSCYKLTVVDVHGNEGPSSLVVPPSLVGVPGEPGSDAVLRLTAASPSFGGRLLVSFSLASESAARLEAFDAAGRRVASLAVLGAGEHRAELGGARLAAGVYVVRLVQDGRALHAKAILLP
jgi:hypothetical protein